MPKISEVKMRTAYAAIKSVQQEQVVMPVRKPTRQEWVRTNSELVIPDIAILEIRDSSAIYIVDGLVADSDIEENRYGFQRVALHVTVTLSGPAFFWPARFGEDAWAESAREAIDMASMSWIRVTSHRGAGHYEVHTPEAELPKPVWPRQDLQALFDLACKNRFIDSPDHEVLKKLRGLF